MKTLTAHHIVYFDTETTGFSPVHSDVLQLSALINRSNIVFNQYIRPPNGVVIENSDIHGITADVLSENGAEPFDVVFALFIKWMTSNFGDDPVYLIAHNCFAFDMRFLEVGCKKHGLTIPTNWVFIDSLIQFRKYNPDVACDNYKLCTLFEWLKDDSVKIEGKLHDSLTDVKVLMYVYLKLSSEFTQEQMDNVLKEGRKSIKCSDLDLPIDDLVAFEKNHVSLFKKYNINTIGDMVIVYTTMTRDVQEDQPKDKPFYQFLVKMSMSYIMRRELTSKIKYVAYMCG